MNLDTKAKILFRFGSLKTVYVVMRSKIITLPMHVKVVCMHAYTCSSTCELPLLYRQTTNLWIIDVNPEGKLLFKFSSLYRG